MDLFPYHKLLPLCPPAFYMQSEPVLGSNLMPPLRVVCLWLPGISDCWSLSYLIQRKISKNPPFRKKAKHY